MLLNAVKDVAIALGDLIQATKVASGKNINDPSMLYLKDSAKVVFPFALRRALRLSVFSNLYLSLVEWF